MDEKELFDRLPDRISQWSEDDRALVELYKSSVHGRCFIETGDPYCDPEMPWSAWVAFAEKIIEADKAARGPAPGEIERISRIGDGQTRATILKLEDFA